jgi:hypothetical protein
MAENLNEMKQGLVNLDTISFGAYLGIVVFCKTNFKADSFGNETSRRHAILGRASNIA